jgi:hydrogenase maturation factor
MCKRREVRYPVNLPACIEGLVYDNRLYPLQNKLNAQLVNISKSGVRFRTDYNALTVGGRVRMKMRVGNDEKSLTADVVFRTDDPPDCSEFGCKLVS